MNDKVFDARHIKDRIRNGWTMNQFLEYYDFSSEDEFKERLEKLYVYEKKTPGQLLSQIKANKKRKGNKSKKGNSKSYINAAAASNPVFVPVRTDNTIDLLHTVPSVVNVKDSIGMFVDQTNSSLEKTETQKFDLNFENVESNDTIENVEVLSSTNNLETWIQKQDEISNYICELESQRKSLLSENKNIQKKFAKSQEILRQLEEEKKRLLETIKELEANQSALCENKELMTMARQEQLEIERNIRKLQVVKVSLGCVSSDSDEAETFDYIDTDIDIEAAEITEKMFELFKSEFSEFLDDISVQQAKELSKYLLIAEKVEKQNDGKNVELYFKAKSAVTDIVECMGKKVVIIN